MMQKSEIYVSPACLITSNSKDNSLKINNSGILLNGGFIITPVLKDEGDSPIINDANHEFRVILEEIDEHGSSKTIHEVFAMYILTFNSSNNVRKHIKTLFSSSQWNYFPSPNHKINSSITSLEINFLLLKIENSRYSYRTNFNILASVTDDRLRTGEPILVVSTPFANLSPKMFMNSMSSGIISNVVGDDGEVFLIDGRCAPGCQGGTVYRYRPDCYDHVGDLIGLVLIPILWRGKEYVGLAVCCNIQHVLRTLTSFLAAASLNTELTPKLFPSVSSLENSIIVHNPLQHITISPNSSSNINISPSLPSPNISISSRPAFRNVVYVECRNSWGSGIVVDVEGGLVVTCYHVLASWNGDTENENLNCDAAVRIPHLKKRYSAKILNNCSSKNTQILNNNQNTQIHNSSSSSKNQPFYDVAVLKLAVTSPCELYECGMTTLKEVDVCLEFSLGMSVYACGHMLFDKWHSLKPSATCGIISKISYHRHEPVLIQSSSCVHAGMSGGPLLDGEGRIVGIIVSNIRHPIVLAIKNDTSGVCYPHINQHVPMSIIWPLICQYLKTKSDHVFEKLHTDDESLIDTWTLNASAKKPALMCHL
ncbi:hypothetical protein HELRODRAFT_159887 [Helobdella robusta]|uniref:Peroxisomal leader peptide-processing protease n=1 Tax=Helobdella robusta TaxID=6412 RepID=T1EPI1_HELRO|nr:hypothetical protein HELRODRAFT_159887 [Helobdella robusta]ESO05811.1 hypothetical protein HELRODRAFT_159887 [Helobdella robusta]